MITTKVIAHISQGLLCSCFARWVYRRALQWVFLLRIGAAGKNKGWYFYYADQAHAWVQVYFPGFGWLDFDTTVGNSDARESPKPDGTPPMQPPKAWLAADGIVENIDTLKKTMMMRVNHMVFHDKEYTLPSPISINMDMKVAALYRDSMDIPLATVQKGDEGYGSVLCRCDKGK